MFGWKGFVRAVNNATAKPSARRRRLNAKNQEEKEHATTEAPTSARPAKKFIDRVGIFERCLTPDDIRINIVRSLVFHGVPDKPGLRSTCWKILLGFLPANKLFWNDHLNAQRQHYMNFVLELEVNPFVDLEITQDSDPKQWEQRSDDGLKGPSDIMKTSVECNENPLGSEDGNKWTDFFLDNELREEIRKDVMRTHSGMHFFSQPIEYSKIAPSTVLSESGTLLDDTKKELETHHDVMSRILFVYAKLNPGIRYVQGMNELLAPVYYVFAQDPDPSFQYNAESDAFFCFTSLMSELKDRFIQSLDGSDSGIASCIDEFKNLLRRTDPELFLHLESCNVDANFYSLRWLTLLLSQEFPLPDVIRIWDSLLADPRRFDFLYYVACSMIICIRSELLQSSYAEMLEMLQHYPTVDIPHILDRATKLRKFFSSTRLSFSENLRQQPEQPSP